MNMMASASPTLRFGKFAPDGSSRASRMLALGRLTVTITSNATMRHVTLRLRCKMQGEGGKWATVPYNEASHVFVESYDGALVATYYPRSGALYFTGTATQAARWSVQAVLRYMSGDFGAVDRVATIEEEMTCGRCGQPLTDPISLERGFGPDCFGAPTVARHVAMWGSQ